MQHARECTLCGHPEGFAADVLSHVIGPVGEDARSKQPLWVHRECAIWSPEAFETGDGHIRGISKVLKRGRVTWCARCQKRGATMGCRLDSCPHSYHKYCAQQAGCTFYPSHYLIACKDHAHLFPTDVPPGGQTPISPYSPYPQAQGLTPEGLVQGPGKGWSGQGIKRLRDTPPEERMRNARRAVKRLRHETRVAMAAGSDDEEHFQKKDRARLARDKLRLNPVVLGQKRPPHDSSQAHHAGTGQPPQPTQVDNNVVAEGWVAVGGHAAVIQQLKEMVLLPLQYPDVFKHMGITPPRGILFHGTPGTGKTLVARALAGACSHSSTTPVTLFARKGADCLGKFAGEAERTLRLLFDEAARRAPSIIFLDELDGLVPARSSNSSGGDQVFASVVSTLLALMDGVVDRGAVVVIGATNRPEALDPALRRPGRFDREVHFGLPSLADRAAILKVHTSRWQEVPSEALLQRIAASTEGFAGADLQALCTAAVMAALTRAAPTLVDQLCDTPEDQEQRQPNQQQGTADESQMHLQGQPGVSGTQQQQTDVTQSHVTRSHVAQPPSHGQQPLDQHTVQPSCMHDDRLHQHSQQHTQPGPQQQQEQQPCKKLPTRPSQNLVEKLRVKAVDWRTALAAAPLPCSARHHTAALSSGHARALPCYLVPLLLPSLTAALLSIAAAQLPWQGALTAALAVAAEAGDKGARQGQEEDDGIGQRERLEATLTQLGAIQALPVRQSGVSSSSPAPLPILGSLQAPSQQQPSPRPCKLLLCGEEDAGQSQVAGAILKLMQGVHVHTVSLPMLVAGGSGDAAVGLVQLLEEAMHRATSHTPLVLHLPTLEAWALETATLTPEEAEEGLAPAAGQAATGPTPQRNAQPSITPLKSYPASISPFRGMVSLQARQGGSGGSRGNPPSAATPGRKAASTPARHLLFPQASSPDQDQPSIPGLLPDQADSASPTLSLPSPKPLRAALHSPTIKAATCSPKPNQEPLTSPAMSLPRPAESRAFASSPAPGPPLQQTTAASHANVADFQSPPLATQSRPVTHGQTPLGENNAHDVEVYVLSEIWKVFEQVVRQIPATQPLLILATCQRSPEELPPLLLHFFQSQSAAAGKLPRQLQPNSVAAGTTNATDVVLDRGMSTNDSSCIPNNSSSSEVFVMGSEMVSESSWQEAAHRTAEAAACMMASAAAAALHSHLLDQMSSAASQQHLPPGTRSHADALPSSSSGRAEGQQGQISGSPRAAPVPVKSSEAAEVSLLGHSQEAEQSDVHTSGPLAGAGPNRSAGEGQGLVLNKNDLQQGLKLHAETVMPAEPLAELHYAEDPSEERLKALVPVTELDQLVQVQRRLKLCGQQLLRDRRIKCAQASVTADKADPIALRADSSIARAGAQHPKQVVSLAAVAQHAQQGCFESMDAFAEAVRSAVASICGAVEARLRRQSRHSKGSMPGYSVRAAAACALGDDVALWCHTTTQQLGLANPAKQRLLAAAQLQLASVQRQSQPMVCNPVGQLTGPDRGRALASGLKTSSDDSSQPGSSCRDRSAACDGQLQDSEAATAAAEPDDDTQDDEQARRDQPASGQQLRASAEGDAVGARPGAFAHGHSDTVSGQSQRTLDEQQRPGAFQERGAVECAVAEAIEAEQPGRGFSQTEHQAAQAGQCADEPDQCDMQGQAAAELAGGCDSQTASQRQCTGHVEADLSRASALQRQMDARRACVQLQQMLQGQLAEALLAMLSRSAHSVRALQELNELVGGMLLELPENLGSLTTSVDPKQLARMLDVGLGAEVLQYIQDALLKHVETYALQFRPNT